MRFLHLARQRLPLLLVLSATARAAVYVSGSTCTVTPLSAGQAARSIGTVIPTERDIEEHGSDGNPGIDAVEPLFDGFAPDINWDPEPLRPVIEDGAPGAMGHYPRPIPSPGSKPPMDVKAQPHLPAREIEPRDPLASTDDVPQILQAFKTCGKDGKIIFTEGTYNLRQVMNTTDLSNCDVEIHGKWVWSADNIQYWLRSSYSVTYAGRSTAWLFGGRNVTMRGFGKALFDGNGQIWIDQNRNQGNQNGRPISLTVWHGTDIFIDGITWRMAQFWHTFIAHSQNVTMTNLDMDTWSNSTWKAVNTDGTDTWNSRDIVIANWTVRCGDDCISVKGNSSNIFVKNITCTESGGMCIGSMGNGVYETVDNVVFEDIELHHSSNAAWIKTYPGNGHVRNVTFRNVHMSEVDQPIYIIPCIYSAQNCDGSHIPITDITWENITGTSRYNVAAGIHCSAAAPCDNLHFSGIDIKPSAGGTAKVLCSNIKNQATSGLQCTGTCPADWPQQLKGNR